MNGPIFLYSSDSFFEMISSIAENMTITIEKKTKKALRSEMHCIIMVTIVLKLMTILRKKKVFIIESMITVISTV
jgi:hypothetical protein